MALSEEQKLKLARALGVTYITVNDQITNLGSTYITAEVETQLGALITEYFSNSVNRNATRIVAMEANFGAEINPERTRDLIRQDMAILLYLTDLINSGQRLMRG
jgi:membrane protease subunit (stomatin/prohibitin family)